MNDPDSHHVFFTHSSFDYFSFIDSFDPHFYLSPPIYLELKTMIKVVCHQDIDTRHFWSGYPLGAFLERWNFFAFFRKILQPLKFAEYFSDPIRSFSRILLLNEPFYDQINNI